MIVGMTLEIVPIGHHINLTVWPIVLPRLAFISVFIVDLLISMFGHGGVTVSVKHTIIGGGSAGLLLFQLFKEVMGITMFWSRSQFLSSFKHFDNVSRISSDQPGRSGVSHLVSNGQRPNGLHY
jgi:hypothetical protein